MVCGLAQHNIMRNWQRHFKAGTCTGIRLLSELQVRWPYLLALL